MDQERIFKIKKVVNWDLFEEELRTVLPLLRCIQILPDVGVATHFNSPHDKPSPDPWLPIDIWPPSRNPTGEEAEIIRQVIADHDPSRLTEKQQKARAVEEALGRLRTDKQEPRPTEQSLSDLMLVLEGRGLI